MTTTPPPTDIKALTDQGKLTITWPDERICDHTFFDLRDACPCASCVDEMTGKKLLDPATIPADIHITAMQPVGNYALKIKWSDGHDTGLYTWARLHQLCR